jgi:hypothetical protein
MGIATQKSSLDEWQREARKLELQGKQEQAAEIRRSILRMEPVPWNVMEDKRFLDNLEKAVDPRNFSNKPKEQTLEYAAYYDEPRLYSLLVENKFNKAKQDSYQLSTSIQKKYLSSFEGKNFKDILGNVDRHGPDYRNQFNQTPLMCAARTGNSALIDTLLSRGANPSLTDNYGRSAFHLALISAATNPDFARNRLGPIYGKLAPDNVSIKVSDRLVKMDAHTIEFFLFNLLVAMFHRLLNSPGHYYFYGVTTAALMEFAEGFPEDVVTDRRKNRTYLNGVLARNEIDREYPYNRMIFTRLKTGHYTFNHDLKIRRADQWIDLHEYLGLHLMAAHPWLRVKHYLEEMGLNDLLKEKV